MTLQADSNGLVRGKFTIPNKVPAGRKMVSFEGNQGSRGEVIFEGRGDIWTEKQQTVISTTVVNNVTNVTQVRTSVGVGYPYRYCWHRRPGWYWRNDGYWWHPVYGNWNGYSPTYGYGPTPYYYGYYRWGYYDPLAQTFRVQKATQIGGAEFFVRAKGTTPVSLQLRTTTNGVPTDTVLALGVLQPIQIEENVWNRWTFAEPVMLQADEEYALVVLCDDAVTELAIAELGKWDGGAQKWVTDQPYQVGVLLSSSNASTWTAHQDKDLAFRLLECTFPTITKTFDLGSVDLDEATDIMLLSESQLPTSGCRVEVTATLPGGDKVLLNSQQPVHLATPKTGTMTVSAKLTGEMSASPVLAPGAQIVHGSVDASGEYVTRAIPAGANSKITLIYDALIPSGATVTAHHKGVDSGDSWSEFGASTTKPIGNDWYEHTHIANGVSEDAVKVKLALAGNTAARPMVANLRVIVT